MAERPKGYGMTAEINAKTDAKFDANLAQEAFDWITEVLESEVDLPAASSIKEVQDALQDGVILVKVARKLNLTSKKVNESKMAFKMMENINNFLEGCYTLEIPKTDLFQTADLYDGTNIPQVVNGIHALGRKASSKGITEYTLGPKEAEKNVRQFTDEQLAEGKNIIGLQSGSNKGASQAGQNFGLGRQIV